MSGRRCAGRRAASGRFPARIDHSQPRTPRALFSPDLCNARTCATPSLQAVSSLLYRSVEPRTTNFNDRPNVHPRPFFTLCSPSALPNLSISDYPVLLSRAFLLFFLPIRTIMDRVAFEPRYYETEKDPRGFFFFSFSTIDAAGRSENFPEKKWSATEQWVATEIRVCALFPLARGRGEERGRARELRVRPRSGVVATLLPFPRTKGSLTRWRAYAWPADPDVTRGHVNRG